MWTAVSFLPNARLARPLRLEALQPQPQADTVTDKGTKTVTVSAFKVFVTAINSHALELLRWLFCCCFVCAVLCGLACQPWSCRTRPFPLSPVCGSQSTPSSAVCRVSPTAQPSCQQSVLRRSSPWALSWRTGPLFAAKITSATRPAAVTAGEVSSCCCC